MLTSLHRRTFITKYPPPYFTTINNVTTISIMLRHTNLTTPKHQNPKFAITKIINVRMSKNRKKTSHKVIGNIARCRPLSKPSKVSLIKKPECQHERSFSTISSFSFSIYLCTFIHLPIMTINNQNQRLTSQRLSSSTLKNHHYFLFGKYIGDRIRQSDVQV